MGEIQSNTDPSQWKHIPGEVNVADDVSRGITVQELNGRWVNGPEFLQQPEELWPIQATAPPSEENMERRQVNVACEVTTRKAEEVINPKAFSPKAFSSWRRLIRVTAWIRRLAEKIRLRAQDQDGRGRPLIPDELREAEMFWVKEAQKALKGRMEKGDFQSLSPFIDDQGVIRVGGRLDTSVASCESRHPALLPHKHWISLLITRQAHQSGHNGAATTAAKVRRKYLVLKVNDLAKKVIQVPVSSAESSHTK